MEYVTCASDGANALCDIRYHDGALAYPLAAARSEMSGIERSRVIKAVAEQSRESVLVVGFEPFQRLRAIWANDAFVSATGYRLDDLIGHNLATIPGFPISSTALTNIFGDGEIGRDYLESIDVTNHVDGTTIKADLVMRPIEEPSGSVQYVVLIYGRTVPRPPLADLADGNLWDKLTELPNRVVFVNRLNRFLIRSRREGPSPTSVLCLDCDRFALVNDSFGRAIGDQLLVAMARRLETFLRPCDTLARFGADEFSILLDGGNERAAISVADRIIGGFSVPFEIGEQHIFVTLSIGIASTSNLNYDAAEDIMRDADIAMYRAKSGGKNRYAVFEAAQRLASIRTLRLQTDLRYAVARGEISIHYQPIFSIARGCIHGFEALMRWTHPILGSIPPSEFIPVAEEAGLIIDLGTWAVREACSRLSEWQKLHPEHRELHVSVNVSAAQLARNDFEQTILAALGQSGLQPRYLHLEITESILIGDPERVMLILKRLREHGIKFYVDDFGTGYSSLAYLHRFALDTVKIDKSFVCGLGLGLAHPKIVETIIVLATHLNLDVIAEGVETHQQASELAALNCTSTQGYLHSAALNRYATSDYLSLAVATHTCALG